MSYTIQRIRDGGYVIHSERLMMEGGLRGAVYACTTVDEALRYLRDHLLAPDVK